MRASTRASRIWFIAAADPEASPIPRVAARTIDSSGMPGTASSIPTIAVNTISITTRGFVSS